jgi:2-aminoadipate transaminase
MDAEFHSSQRARWAHGQPISQLMARALENPELISLAAGFVDGQTLPVEPVRQAMEELWRDAGAVRAALQYGTTPGYPPLRELLRERARQADGPEHVVDLEQVVVTAGSNQLLHLVSESLLDPGDLVLCASPTYFVYLGLLAGLGVQAVGVASDAEGMVPGALEDQLARLDAGGELRRVKAIYLVPYFDNPGGVTMPLERRAAVVDAAKRWSRHGRIHVISDEAYRELRYSGSDVPGTLACDEERDTVVVAGTFSKSFSPGIRVGWGFLPSHLVGPVNDQKGNVDFGSPNFNQHVMARVLGLGLFDAHVQSLRESYHSKLSAMLTAADRFLAPVEDVTWLRPTGGLYVWVRLPQHVATGTGSRLFQAAVDEGVLYVPGEYCFPAQGPTICHNTLRLSFGVQSCEKIFEGVEKLARAIARVAG